MLTLAPLDEDDDPRIGAAHAPPGRRGRGHADLPRWRATSRRASADKGFDWLDAPVKTVTAADTPVPFAAVLEALYMPNGRAGRRCRAGADRTRQWRTAIVMPSFGMYTAEGTLVAWLQARRVARRGGRARSPRSRPRRRPRRSRRRPTGCSTRCRGRRGQLQVEGLIGCVLARGGGCAATVRRRRGAAKRGRIGGSATPPGAGGADEAERPRRAPRSRGASRVEHGVDLATWPAPDPAAGSSRPTCARR